MRISDWSSDVCSSDLPTILAGGVLGVGIGAAIARWVDNEAILLIVGTVAVLFPLHRWFGRRSDQPAPHSLPKGLFWSACSGFTSFIAHAGNPPLMVYMVPLKLDKTLFMGTAVIFFAAINRSEEHTSELQSLMRISYAVFCLKTKNRINTQ